MRQTCFRDTGKVSFPQNSGLFTISLHMFLQDRQTAAHATTCFRAGHVLSLSSSLLITSYSNSGGRLAQRPLWITRGWSCRSWKDPWDFPRWWPDSRTSKLRLDKLPKLSLTSRTMLRNDILQHSPRKTTRYVCSKNHWWSIYKHHAHKAAINRRDSIQQKVNNTLFILYYSSLPQI